MWMIFLFQKDEDKEEETRSKCVNNLFEIFLIQLIWLIFHVRLISFQ